MRRASPLIVLLLSLPPLLRTAAAQSAGSRVRVTADGAPPRVLVGTVVGQNADSLHVAVPGLAAPVAVARHSVRQLEVSRGWRRATGDGAALGVEAGALAGAVVAVRTAPSFGRNWPVTLMNGWDRMWVGSAIGGAIGAAVGALIGSRVKTERWQPWSSGPRLVALTPGSTGVSVSIPF
ncbi:MAG TPA: hypothetical protein VFD76_09270 [Gemmatimonadales bacterium]|nr:hypothetical protein [Gemmatimonadales bacterium]